MPPLRCQLHKIHSQVHSIPNSRLNLEDPICLQNSILRIMPMLVMLIQFTMERVTITPKFPSMAPRTALETIFKDKPNLSLKSRPARTK